MEGNAEKTRTIGWLLMRRKEVNIMTEKEHRTMAEFFQAFKGTPFAEMMEKMRGGGRCAPASCCGDMMSRMMECWSRKEAEKKEAGRGAEKTDKT